MRPKHPGRTASQRRVLDAIGCGDFTPRMTPQTRDAMLKAGIIEECGRKYLGRDRFGAIFVIEYAMPIPVHMQWCDAVASEEEQPS